MHRDEFSAVSQLGKGRYRKAEGVALSYFPYFIKAVAETLKEFPIVNSQGYGPDTKLY